MPITYHFRSRSPDSADDLLSSPGRESFHDDSIVLSDLIRTGETSRLRRRGAMRIEATGPSSSSRYRRIRSPRHSDDTHAESPPHTWTIVESRSRRIPRHLPMLEVSDDDLELGDSDSDSGDEMVFSASFNRAISEQTGQLMSNRSNPSRGRIASEPDGEKSPAEGPSYTLVCGGPMEIAAGLQSGAESVRSSAFASFILPGSPLSSSSLVPPSSTANDTNGCGAILHTRVFPRYRQHQPMWTANTPATGAVVPLERVYFDDVCAKEKLSPKVIKQESCGCSRIGIGCAYCGNPLGFRLTPCRIMRESVSSRRSTLSEPCHASKPDHDDSDLHLYTFFCSSTTSPEGLPFPSVERASSGRSDASRSRSHPLLPPPPPLIRLTSDTESDTDEEVIIDFRAPDSSSLPSTVLGGGLTTSPEPTVLNLEPNPPPLIPPPLPSYPRHHSPENAEQYSELEEALAGWASVVRGVGVTASSLGEDNRGDFSQSPNIGTFPRSSRPERRNALGFDAEGELGFTFTNTNEPQDSSLNRDVSSVLFEDTSSLPGPGIEGSPSSTPTELNDADQTTPRASVWDMSFEDGYPSTSFWGRPTSGGGQWTWSNELAEAERERDREGNDQPVRVFDPDGEFLEGLDGEWGEDMARRLGFGSQEEKNDGNETSTTSGFWWS